VPLSLQSVVPALGVLALLALGVTGLGFSLAWVMDSTAGYHGIMMLVLMPMLLLSGAFFPMEEAHPALSWIRFVNPMTYGVGALRHALQGPVSGVPPFAVCLLGTVLFAAATFALGTFVVRRRSVRDAT
jgi:ABC-2 type transport system permease protein